MSQSSTWRHVDSSIWEEQAVSRIHGEDHGCCDGAYRVVSRSQYQQELKCRVGR